MEPPASGVEPSTPRRDQVNTWADLSLPQPLTRGRARTLYRLSLWGLVLAGAAVVAVSLQMSAIVGVSSVMVAAPVLLATISSLRLGLESALALMRIADTLSEIAEHEAVIAVNTSGPDRARRVKT